MDTRSSAPLLATNDRSDHHTERSSEAPRRCAFTSHESTKGGYKYSGIGSKCTERTGLSLTHGTSSTLFKGGRTTRSMATRPNPSQMRTPAGSSAQVNALVYHLRPPAVSSVSAFDNAPTSPEASSGCFAPVSEPGKRNVPPANRRGASSINLAQAPAQWQAIFAGAGLGQQELDHPEKATELVELLARTMTDAQLSHLPPLPGVTERVMKLRQRKMVPWNVQVVGRHHLCRGGACNQGPAPDANSEQGVVKDPDSGTHRLFREHLMLDLDKLAKMKTTVFKAIIAVELARSWTDLIVLIRPLAFGMPIEVTHVPSCHESLVILSIVFILASWTLYMLTQVKFAASGLVMTSAFMWSGATFSPTATTCLKSLHDPEKELEAALGYTVFAAVTSVVVLSLKALLSEQPSKSPALSALGQTLNLFSIFIVISAAAVCNKAIGEEIPWIQPGYVAAYLGSELPAGSDVAAEAAAAAAAAAAAMGRRLASVEGSQIGASCNGTYSHAALAQAISSAGLVSLDMLPNPAVLAIIWALVVNGVLVRAAVALTVRQWASRLVASFILFIIKFLAFYSGFQYIIAIKLSWQVLTGSTASPSLGMLAIHAMTVVLFAALYINFGSPISGIPGLAKDRPITTDEADKAFHDTTIGQSIGVSFTPLFHKMFQTACLAGGHLETMLFPPVHEEAAAAAAYTQDWEIATAIVYVVFITTPTAVWLYHAVVLAPQEKKAEGQNAAAAADDGGGDDGGDDGGGDDGGDDGGGAD